MDLSCKPQKFKYISETNYEKCDEAGAKQIDVLDYTAWANSSPSSDQ